VKTKIQDSEGFLKFRLSDASDKMIIIGFRGYSEDSLDIEYDENTQKITAIILYYSL
jgi:hypothetical protein